MRGREIDPERLAALLDGRLDERARAEVLEHLAASEDDFDVFVDAVAVSGELEPSGETEGVTPLRPGSRGGWAARPRTRWLALAAAVAAIGLAPWLWMRAHAPASDDPARFAAALEDRSAGLPNGWDSSPWGATRGAGDPLTPEARAVRIGVRLTDLELEAQARDMAGTAAMAEEVARLLEEVPAAGPVASLYQEISRRASAPRGEVEPLLEEARGAAASVTGQDLVELGAWAEAARVAMARRDLAFFRTRQSRKETGDAKESPALTPDVRASVQRIEALLDRDRPDWGALEGELLSLLRAAAR